MAPRTRAFTGSIAHSGDDTYAIWSEGGQESNVSFVNNYAALPRYPRTWLASCFAQYGGNRSAFSNNRCFGTGERGMIFFEAGFNGAFAANASSNVKTIHRTITQNQFAAACISLTRS